MSCHAVRKVVVRCVLAAAVAAVPSEGQAFFGGLFGCCGSRTTYRPVFTAPVCAPCQPQTVQYVPQTCYRAVCQNVPVTTYRPVTTCDPCSGCPVTCMRPVTSYVRQVQYVPYTSYRPVVTTAYPAATCVSGGCATAPCGVGAMTYSAPSYTTPTYSAPGSSCCTPSYTPAPGATSTAPMTTPAPSLPPSPAVAPEGRPQTFDKRSINGPSDAAEPDIPGSTNPVPDESVVPNSTQKTNDRRPRLFDPRDRTAGAHEPGPRLLTALASARVPHQAARVATPQPMAAAQERLDAAGWRAAGR